MEEAKKYQALGKTYYIPKLIHDQYERVTDILRGKDTTNLDQENSLKVLANVLIPEGKEWTPELEAQQLEEFHRIDMDVEVEALKDFFAGYVAITNGMIGVLEILEMQNELSKMNVPKLLESLQSLKDANQSLINPKSSTHSPAAN
jgi:hypothetical protein